MVPLESPDDLALRIGREKRARQLEREDALAFPANRLRIGSVPYLNAVPLTRGLEEKISFIPPSKLAEKLRNNELDAALVSITEVLFHDLYDILDGIAVASLGEVKSVFLAHKDPLEAITEIACDTASLTSVQLLKVLLDERGLTPKFSDLSSYDPVSMPRNVLLIGDPALNFLRTQPEHQIFDLGAAWYEMTGLPFVYAVWALRRDADTREIRSQLKEARDFGLETLDSIIQNRTEYDYNFRRDYLGWHIHFHLGTDEKRGIQRFIELLRKHGLAPVYSPRYVP